MSTCTPESPCTAAALCDECARLLAVVAGHPDPLAEIAASWPYTVEPPQTAGEADTYRRTGVAGLIGERAELGYQAKRAAGRA